MPLAAERSSADVLLFAVFSSRFPELSPGRCHFLHLIFDIPPFLAARLFFSTVSLFLIFGFGLLVFILFLLLFGFGLLVIGLNGISIFLLVCFRLFILSTVSLFLIFGF